ncbi:hypothetical protein D770_04140 [Flammeovirgaceae bacterium 311]|nr:hypothetical protein D770_04140 [Flammeovirgaceae bacterium 311]
MLTLKVAAQNCDSVEYSLLNYIIDSKNINLLTKRASSHPILCTYLESDTRSKYEYFIESVLPKDSDEIIKWIDPSGFRYFIEQNVNYQWNIDCIERLKAFDKTKKGRRRTNSKKVSEYSYTISKPLFTKGYEYAIVAIGFDYGSSPGGAGGIEIYKRDESGNWTFYTNGGCGYTYH